MKTFQVPAIFNQFRTLKDGSIQFGFESNELSPEDAAALFSQRNQLGWVLFAPSEHDESSVPDMPAPQPEESKSPATRLRNVIFVWWKQCGEKGDFETFYRQKMEKVIEWVRVKLT